MAVSPWVRRAQERTLPVVDRTGGVMVWRGVEARQQQDQPKAGKKRLTTQEGR